MGMVCGKGVNDMYRGWYSESEYNKRVYQVWYNMIQRCYSEKYHEKYPTYIGCYACEHWLKLSNFVEDIVKIDGYELWLNNPNKRVALDKDMKSNGENKCYCLENCCFTSNESNTKQANKTRDYKGMKGNQNAKGKRSTSRLIERYTLDEKLIDIKYSFEYVEMGFYRNNIYNCCKGNRKTHKGYIFRYHKE